MMTVAEKTLRIVNRRGLHARAAAKFVKLVEHRKANVTVIKDDVSVCGSSIMGLLMLSAGQNSDVRVLVTGDNAEAVLEELALLVENRFGEEA